MNPRWTCKKCDFKSIYPLEKCAHCNSDMVKTVGRKFKVVNITKVSIPSPYHPIIPYSVLILKDEYGNLIPKKTMKDYKIGDGYKREPSDDENAVAIVKIKYDVYEAVKESLSLIGDVDINENTKILIKPNIMVAAYHYLAMTTNQKVVDVLIQLLLEKGAKKENIVIAEQVQYNKTEEALKKTGFSRLIEKYNTKFIDLSKTEFVEKQSNNYKFEKSKEVFDKDLIINVPVLKTHILLGISGALENMTRVVSKKTFDELSKGNINEAIANLHKILPKYLTLGDGTIGMQGNGPLQYGEPAFINMIFASKDPVAHDKVFQEMFLLRKADHVETAASLGIGSSDLREIVIVGEELDACKRELKPAIGSKLIKF